MVDLEVAYQQLKIMEEKYRNIFENGIEGIYQTTLEGRYLSVNPAFARMFGFDSPEEMMGTVTGMEGQAYVNAEDRERLKRLLAEHDIVEGFETQLYRRDGSAFWVSINAHAVRDSDGNILYYEGTNENIAERKQAEEGLRQSRQQLKNIVDFLPDATFVIDNDKKVMFWNRACEEMTGVREEEIIGKGDYAYAIPFYGEAKPLLIDYVTMNSDELSERQWVTRKDGRLYAEAFMPAIYNGKGAFLSGHASPLCDGNGVIVGAIECVRDITEFKRFETQLRQSQKMEAIGTMAGGIAHDFNNILTVLIGNGTLLQMHMEKESPLRVYVDQILTSAQRAVGLTQSLLAFSRQQPVSLTPVGINASIRVTRKLLERLLTEDIHLATVLAPEEIIVMADATQVDQILFNLVTNARDAMPNGGTLVIETRPAYIDSEFIRFHGDGRPGWYALISITDTGIGMDEATRERIFDPFFTTKEAGKGTGLGLFTVYGIVKQHDGYINVYSEPNQGTTFNVYLPVTEAETEEKGVPRPEARGGTERILVAEDDPNVRGFIRAILNKYGYTVIEAIDGEDAVDKFKEHHDIDLLILDSVMPKKNGRKVYDEIHIIAPHVRAIFMSGYTRDIVLDKGIGDKEFDFIAKPLAPDGLLRKVREVLER